jgi:hypothetical protein
LPVRSDAVAALSISALFMQPVAVSVPQSTQSQLSGTWPLRSTCPILFSPCVVDELGQRLLDLDVAVFVGIGQVIFPRLCRLCWL